MMEKLKGIITEEEGQGMTEYGLILGLIVVGVIGALIFLGDEIAGFFDQIQQALSGETGGE
nr:Flp family type IVb pilin [Alteribacillus iranensis]